MLTVAPVFTWMTGVPLRVRTLRGSPLSLSSHVPAVAGTLSLKTSAPIERGVSRLTVMPLVGTSTMSKVALAPAPSATVLPDQLAGSLHRPPAGLDQVPLTCADAEALSAADAASASAAAAVARRFSCSLDE